MDSAPNQTPFAESPIRWFVLGLIAVSLVAVPFTPADGGEGVARLALAVVAFVAALAIVHRDHKLA